jgi:hypothetical protein
VATSTRRWRLQLSRPARDALTFLAGLAIMGWETLAERADRPYLLGAALAMLGLPYVRFLDRREKERADEASDD